MIDRPIFVNGYITGALPREESLEYAKTIIQDLLNNSDEYAKQRAMDWLNKE
jgi:NADH:ubiquinone oxidoreductase subunit B-like Fe-S oxidoreductase